MAIGNARSNSSRRPAWASETIVAVTVVPMLAPMIIGIALARGSGFSGAATRPTTIAVVTDELWTTVVASNPTINPKNGFDVAAKKLWMKSSPSSRNPSPSPLTPARKTNRRATAARRRGARVDGGRLGGSTVGRTSALSWRPRGRPPTGWAAPLYTTGIPGPPVPRSGQAVPWGSHPAGRLGLNAARFTP